MLIKFLYKFLEVGFSSFLDIYLFHTDDAGIISSEVIQWSRECHK